MLAAAQAPAVRDPLTVRRPARRELRIAEAGEVVLIDALALARGDVEEPETLALIRVRDLPAVRRPVRVVVERGRIAERDVPRRRKAVLIANVQLVFAGGIG